MSNFPPNALFPAGLLTAGDVNQLLAALGPPSPAATLLTALPTNPLYPSQDTQILKWQYVIRRFSQFLSVLSVTPLQRDSVLLELSGVARCPEYSLLEQQFQ